MSPDDAIGKRGQSVSGRLWQAWRARRRRIRVRQLAQGQFRLTREGLHFVGVLLFIFFGAVIRDINLLILLAGAMIGLLVLQWRFNSRTLSRLKVERRLPRATTVGRETDVFVDVANPKRWLGAWLVLIEDPIRRLKPEREKQIQTGASIIDEVRPQGRSQCAYRVNILRRGKYLVGPTTLSTRFPIGLGRSWRVFDNESQLLVRPAIGELTALVPRLFQRAVQGQSQSAAAAGSNEAEFYGLRPWITGDSRRWIHWRTTARLGELSVRQFERQQHQQACILLDLYQEAGKSGDDAEASQQHVERAIAFVATLTNSAVMYHRDKISVAIAADRQFLSASIQSLVLVENLLDELATVQPSQEPDLDAAINSLSHPLNANPYLLVVSTRPDQSQDLFKNHQSQLMRRLASRLKIRWLNVAAGDTEPYFQWTLPK